jgi:hypothetical protein
VEGGGGCCKELLDLEWHYHTVRGIIYWEASTNRGAVRRGQVFMGKKWWCVRRKLHVTSWKAAVYVVTAVRISNHAEGTSLCILKH